MLLFAAASVVQAQGVVSARAGLVNHVQGLVMLNDHTVDRNEQLPQLQNGDNLSSEAGRAEVVLGPGVIIRIAESSRLRMLDSRREDTRVELLEGTALVEVISQVKGAQLHILHGGSSTEFRRPGLYRFEASLGELDVYGGEARVEASDKKVSAKRGDAVRLREQLLKKKFDPKRRTDTVHEWAAERSFLLYNSDPEARRKQTNWTPVSLGWVWSANYRRQFYSQQVAEDILRRLIGDAVQQREFSDTQNSLQRPVEIDADPPEDLPDQ